MKESAARRHRRPLLRPGRRPRLPEADVLANKELGEVVEILGFPLQTTQLGLGHLVAYWRVDRRLVEVVFDEVGRASRVGIS